MKKVIGILGLWHLGCVLTAAWSKLGNRVLGFDYDGSRIEKLDKGVLPIYEPNLNETIQEGINNQTIYFSTKIESLSACDFIFLSYDTPVLNDDSSDTTILERSVDDAGRILKENAVIIVSSQSPIGLCSLLRIKLKQMNSSLELAYSPENLRLGDAIQCYLNPARIILGTANQETEIKCRELFSQIRASVIPMNLESAEMVKHGINSFLSMSIVFANHLADICELSGARIDDVVRGMQSDPRIGEKAYLSPGIGFSGGTLGRDLKVLDGKNVESRGNAKLFGIIHDLNSKRKASIIKRIENILGNLKGSSIGILGVTYKPGTSTLRRSLPLEIVELLINENAQVRVYDPKADYSELSTKPKFRIANSIEEASDSVDLLVLLTEWSEFRSYEWEKAYSRMNKPYLFDAKNYLDEKMMRKIGFKYYSIGR